VRGDALPSHAHFPVGPALSPSLLARRAVGFSAAAALAITTSLVLFGVAYAIGGPDATAGGRVGVLVVVSLFGGFLASLAAFALAIVARLDRERWAPLWLPLSVFPTVLAFVPPTR
jgi:hypothetical protein